MIKPPLEKLVDMQENLSLQVRDRIYALPDFYKRDLHFAPEDYQKYFSEFSSAFPSEFQELRSSIGLIYSGNEDASERFVSNVFIFYEQKKLNPEGFQLYMNIFTRSKPSFKFFERSLR